MRRLVISCLALFVAAASAHAQSRPTPPRRPPQPPRVRLSVNGGLQPTATTARQAFTFPLNQEDARIANDVDLRRGTMFDVGGAYRITRTLWAGMAFSSVARRTTSALSAELPHPFYFDQPRRVAATVDGLEGTEKGVHFSLMSPLAVTRTLEVAIFGGPSRFSITQDLVTGIDYDDSYPFDEVTVTRANTVNATASGWGGHVGADISWRLSPPLRVGALLRFARASATYDAGNGDAVAVSPGGLMAGVGVRVVF